MNWRRNAKRNSSKDSMTDSYKIKNSVFEWDALADEDHTYHLSAQEYLHYKNKWWLHWNKQGSNTLPLRHRSDFKRALSTLQRLQQEAGDELHVCLLTLTSTNNGSWHKVHLLHGGIGKVHGGLLVIPKVKKEMNQVLSERDDPFLAVFGKNLRKWLSRIQFILLQLDRWQLTAVYCNRRGGVKTTPQMTRFRDASVQQFGYRWNWRS